MADISYSLPTFGNMIQEPLQRNQNTFRKNIDGKRYYIQEIDKRSLFAYEAGPVEISAAEAKCKCVLL